MTNLTEEQKSARHLSRLLHHELLHSIFQLQYHEAADRLVINDGIVFIYTTSNEVISLTFPELEPIAKELMEAGASVFDEVDGPDFAVIPVNTNQE